MESKQKENKEVCSRSLITEGLIGNSWETLHFGPVLFVLAEATKILNKQTNHNLLFLLLSAIPQVKLDR